MSTTAMRKNNWRTAEEKERLLKEAETSSIWRVAVQNGIAPSQVYRWRKKHRLKMQGVALRA